MRLIAARVHVQVKCGVSCGLWAGPLNLEYFSSFCDSVEYLLGEMTRNFFDTNISLDAMQFPIILHRDPAEVNALGVTVEFSLLMPGEVMSVKYPRPAYQM